METSIPNKLISHIAPFQRGGLCLDSIKKQRQETKRKFENEPATRGINRSTLRIKLVQKLSLWLGDESKPTVTDEWMNARHHTSKLVESVCDLTYFTHNSARQEVRWVNAANAIPTWVESLEPVIYYNRDIMKAIHLLSTPSFINPTVEFDAELMCLLFQITGVIIYVNGYTWQDFI